MNMEDIPQHLESIDDACASQTMQSSTTNTVQTCVDAINSSGIYEPQNMPCQTNVDNSASNNYAATNVALEATWKNAYDE